jgi:hypothetical protein
MKYYFHCLWFELAVFWRSESRVLATYSTTAQSHYWFLAEARCSIPLAWQPWIIVSNICNIN